MNWQEYEEEVFEELRCRYPGAPIARKFESSVIHWHLEAMKREQL